MTCKHCRRGEKLYVLDVRDIKRLRKIIGNDCQGACQRHNMMFAALYCPECNEIKIYETMHDEYVSSWQLTYQEDLNIRNNKENALLIDKIALRE